MYKKVEELDNIPLDTGVVKFNDMLPDPYLYTYYNDLRNRTLYLDEEIKRETLIPLTKMILAWNNEDKETPIKQRKPIKILIYSYGGEVDATLHFIDVCLMSKTPIWTFNMGAAMSGGFYILLAGHKRFAIKNSQSLVHQGAGSFDGSAEEIKTHTTQYNKLLKTLADYTLERTKIPKSLFDKKKKSEWFINGVEQVELGVVDEMITDIDIFN